MWLLLPWFCLSLISTLYSSFLQVSAFSCDGTCSGHGACDRSTGICSCFPGYIGVTCKYRSCPYDIAWVDYASDTDVAHGLAECSAMGLCDRSTGTCKCNSGFEGNACERMSCPTCTNGRCISMREAAAIQDNTNFFVATTYTLWDADKIFGCQCDNGFFGYDCSQRACPKGDDPMTTGQLNEVQNLVCICDGCTGTFALTFRRRTTVNLSPNDDDVALKTALEALDTIHGVTVSLSGLATTLCSASGVTISIEFTNNPGDLPDLQVQDRLTGGNSDPSVTLSATGAVQGTREEVYCSNHGSCDTSTGLCTCQVGFSSSNGANSPGALGDCGYGTPTFCPTTSSGICNGQGTCSNYPNYQCTCNAGFTGYDCSKRTCPSGIAWFDGATAPNTAHAMAVCSNKGSCDTATGLCSCLSMFMGSACEILECPGTSSTCNGHGTCKTMQQLALVSAENGVPRGVTYGNTLNVPSTWDYNKIQGCDCNKDFYMGPYSGAYGDFRDYDCFSRFCPLGADPFETGKVNEKQTLVCTADGGSFTLTFRQQTTVPIAYSATTATVKAALEQLTSIGTVNIAFDTGVAVCGASAVTTTIEFTYEQGDLPLLTATTSSLTLTSSTATIVINELVKGTKANAECSRRGVCDHSTGVCSCFDYFLSSDGDGNFGTRGDCGYISPYPATAVS